MFPRFFPSAQPGDITSVTWSQLEFVYVGPGNNHELRLIADVTIANIFIPQNLIFQAYVSLSGVWYDFIPQVVSSSGVISFSNSSVFTTVDPNFWTKVRFALQLGGQSSYSAEQTIPL